MQAALVLMFALSPLCHADPSGVDTYLDELRARDATFDQRLADVVKDSLGTPYADGPLGEGPDGVYDKDPLIDLSRADCVTFIEQSIALAAGRDYSDMFAKLQKIRYQDGIIDFEHRNHFFITDWTENNSFCVEVTGDLDVPTRKIQRTISRNDFFKRVNAPGLGTDTPDRVEQLTIVPSSDGRAAEDALPSPSVIVFVGKVDWLFALHTALFIRDSDGVGRLYHASSKHGEVIAADLSDYLDEQGGRYLGIAAYRVTEPVFEN